MLEALGEKAFFDWYKSVSKYPDFDRNALLDDVWRKYGNTGSGSYEVSQWESKSGRPELFSYDAYDISAGDLSGDYQTVFVFDNSKSPKGTFVIEAPDGTMIEKTNDLLAAIKQVRQYNDEDKEIEEENGNFDDYDRNKTEYHYTIRWQEKDIPVDVDDFLREGFIKSEIDGGSNRKVYWDKDKTVAPVKQPKLPKMGYKMPSQSWLSHH